MALYENRVTETLGYIINFYAVSEKEATDRLSRAMKMHEAPNIKYTQEELMMLIVEINDMRDQIAWYKGYSDIVNDDGQEDYFLYAIPGYTYVPERGITKAEHKREYQKEVKKDLVRYYKYSPRMKRVKRKHLNEMIEVSLKYHKYFGRFGRDCVFTGGSIVFSYEDLKTYDKSIERLIYENTYIDKAKGIRNPYMPPHKNFTGRYKKIILTKTAKRWINKECQEKIVRKGKIVEEGGNLASLSAYLTSSDEDETLLIRSGYILYKTLETLIRIALYGTAQRYTKDNGKISTRYRTTDAMKEYFDVGDHIDVFEVGSLARMMIGIPTREEEEEFIKSKEEDTSEVPWDLFVQQMSDIQTYYDIIRDQNAKK